MNQLYDQYGNSQNGGGRSFGDLLAADTRVGVEDIRLEAMDKAKDTKKIWSQGQPYRWQTPSSPRKGMFEAKDTSVSALQKKVFRKNFQTVSRKKRFPKNFSGAPQTFNNPKNRAVLEPKTGQFSRIWGFEAKVKDLTFKAKVKSFEMCPQGQGRPRGLHFWQIQNAKKKRSEFVCIGFIQY